MRFVLLVVVAALFVSCAVSDSNKATPCLKCHMFVEMMMRGKVSAQKACLSLDMCERLLPVEQLIRAEFDGEKPVGDVCRAANFCNEPEKWHSQMNLLKESSPYDIRVSPALGSRGPNKVRVTFVEPANATSDVSSYFLYNNQFQYRWTNKKLHTLIADVIPGTPTNIDLGVVNISVTLPPPTQTVTRGILVADPCFSSQYIPCDYGSSFDIFARLSSLVDLAVRQTDVDFWGILGDNFYDQEGALATAFFSQLSLATKATPFLSVVGNHDLWTLGTPWLEQSVDSFGYGFLQYYGQDTISGQFNASQPYDFSVDPNHPADPFNDLTYIADVSNFFSYNKIGRIGFIGFSGAHTWNSSKAYFAQACQWISTADVDWIVLLGHWNEVNYGCQKGMDTPTMYNTLLTLDGCSQMSSRIKYVMGHTHCNLVTQANVGFMIGGFGMNQNSDGGCGEFGLPYIRATKNTFEFFYFPINNVKTNLDQYTELTNCIALNGIEGCTYMANVWVNTTA